MGDNPRMSDIVLTTLNARYVHASLGLRYLRANLGELHADAAIREFVIGQTPEDIAERLLADKPRIIGFGVYIWNVEETTRLVAQLKRVAPDIMIVLGGPGSQLRNGRTAHLRAGRLRDHRLGRRQPSPQLCAATAARRAAGARRSSPACSRRSTDIDAALRANTPMRTSRSGSSMSKPRAAARSSASSACRRWTRPPGRSSWSRFSANWKRCTNAARAISNSSTAPST